MKRIIYVLIVLSFTFSAHAKTTGEVCFSCYTSGSFKIKADQQVNIDPSDFVKVINPKTGVLKTYRVELEPYEPGAGPGGLYLTEITSSSRDVTLAQMVYDRYAALEADSRSIIQVPINIIESGLDVIGNSSRLDQLEVYLSTGRGILPLVNNYMAALGDLGLNTLGMTPTTYILSFSDGTEMQLTIKEVQPTIRRVYFNLTRLKDKNGNTIPKTRQEAMERIDELYVFENVSQVQAHLDAMANFGVYTVRLQKKLTGTISDIKCEPKPPKCTKVSN